jgi:cyclic-di-GMP-binding protein
MPSFDAVSKLAMHEVDNALLNTQKEVGTRFDFRGTGTELEMTSEGIVIRSDSEGRLEAAYGVLEEKLVKRHVSLQSLDPQKIEKGPRGTFRQLVKLKQGVEVEKAREIVKLLKESKLKVSAAIQDAQVRVSGKKRDDLQAAIQFLKAQDLGLPLQFVNFRD